MLMRSLDYGRRPTEAHIIRLVTYSLDETLYFDDTSVAGCCYSTNACLNAPRF